MQIRKIAWIGFSALGHIGFLALLAMGPLKQALEGSGSKGAAGTAEWVAGGETAGSTEIQVETTVAAPVAAPAPVAVEAPIVAPIKAVVANSSSAQLAVPQPSKQKAQAVAKLPKAQARSNTASPSSSEPSSSLLSESDSVVAVESSLAPRDLEPILSTSEADPELADRKSEETKSEKVPEALNAQVPQHDSKAEEAIAQAEDVAMTEALTSEASEPLEQEKQLPPPVAGAPKPTEAAALTQGTANGGEAGVSQAAMQVPAGVEIREASELTAKDGNPSPQYPVEDRKARREGKNVLVGKVGQDGKMEEVFLEKSSGSKSLDRSAIDAFQRWEFSPGQEGYIRKPFEFRLKGETALDGADGRLRR
jgi:TonB family protein